MLFLLMLHSTPTLLVKIPLMLVNIKPYLEGPRRRWVQEVCGN